MITRRNFLKWIPSLPVLLSVPPAIICPTLAAAATEPNEYDDHCALLDSVGNDQLLVRRESGKWVVLHREPKSKFESKGGYTVHYNHQVFVVETVTKNKAGKMKLLMLRRTRPFAIEGVDLGRAEKFTVTP